MFEETDAEKDANGYELLTSLIDIVRQCQKRFVGKTEIATEKDPLVKILCDKLQQVLSYGLKPKSNLSVLQNVHDIVYGNEYFEFWDFCEKHLTKHELHRFSTIENVSTKRGKLRALIESALNERALARYLSIWIGDAGIGLYFEPWSLLVNAEATNLLPSIAAGLSSILFAISIGSSCADKIKTQKQEPLIYVPAPKGVPKRVRAIQREILSPDNNEQFDLPSKPAENNTLLLGLNNFQEIHSVKTPLEINNENIGNVNFPNFIKDNSPPETNLMESNSNVGSNVAPTVDSMEPNLSPGLNCMAFNYPPAVNLMECNTHPDMNCIEHHPTPGMNCTEFSHSPDMNFMDQNVLLDNISLSSSNSGRVDLLRESVNVEYNTNQSRIPQENNLSDLKSENTRLQNFIGSIMNTVSFTVSIPKMKLVKPERFSKSFYLYSIVVKFKIGPCISVQKRYSEFHGLHMILSKTNNVISLLDFPPKNYFGNTSESFLEDRRQRLECYLRSVLTILPETVSCKRKEQMEIAFPFLKLERCK